MVVLETGLRGRFDATNILQNPALSIITSIGLEHTRILGDTIEEIAKEKAGIIREKFEEKCPVLIGPSVPLEVIREVAEKKNANVYECKDLLGKDHATTTTSTAASMVEDYDLENSITAKAAMVLLQFHLANHIGGNSTSTMSI